MAASEKQTLQISRTKKGLDSIDPQPPEIEQDIKSEKSDGLRITPKWKKILRGTSFIVALVGCFLLLIFAFLIYGALEKTKEAILNNLDGLYVSLANLEGTIVSIENELDATNETLDSLQNSIDPLSDGLASTASALDDTADALSTVGIISSDIADSASDMEDAAASIQESADELGGVADGFEEHKGNIAGLKTNMNEIKNSISSQKTIIAETQESLEDVFNTVHIANILFFFVIMCMFAILLLNSAAGLID